MAHSFGRLFVFPLLLGLGGCATTHPRSREPTPSERKVVQALHEARDAFQQKNEAGISAVPQRARLAADTLFLIDTVMDAECAALVEKGEIELAAQKTAE